MVSIAQLQEVPSKNMILLVGLPGSGKSYFCEQTVVQNLAMDRPIIYVTTELGQSRAEEVLRKKGLGRIEPGLLSFVDAYNETVGVDVPDRPDTAYADCNNLSSIDIAVTKLMEQIGRTDILLVFDSLTSPYLFNGPEILRFMRQTLSRFAANGNAVLACMDEGCGKQEDLVAMTSVADGIISMAISESTRVLSVVKHPKVSPTKIETPLTWSRMIAVEKFDPKLYRRTMEAVFFGRSTPFRKETGDFVNIFWRNLASWSGMLWDPKRFPTMAYELDKEIEAVTVREGIARLPWYMRFLFRFMIPRNLSEVRNVKKLLSRQGKHQEKMGMRIVEYVDNKSKKDEHYFKVYEGYNCWGLDNVGARLAFQDCGLMAGAFKAFEKEERDWNVAETKCVGLGDPYCEYKFMLGEIDKMKDFLEGLDISTIERIRDRLMNHLIGFLVHGRPLSERPRLGSGLSFYIIGHVTSGPALLSERYRMALRMGGAKAGKEVGEHLMNHGIEEDQAVKRFIDFMQYCRVGKITLGETIRIKENCEPFGLEAGEPSCYFTTGFLNGFFSAVKNKHVKETKCIAMGDLYCEWEFR